MYLEFGQLPEFFGCIEDELSALQETDRRGRGEGRRRCCYRGGDVGQQQTVSVSHRRRLTLPFIHSLRLRHFTGVTALSLPSKCHYRTCLQSLHSSETLHAQTEGNVFVIGGGEVGLSGGEEGR